MAMEPASGACAVSATGCLLGGNACWGSGGAVAVSGAVDMLIEVHPKPSTLKPKP